MTLLHLLSYVGSVVAFLFVTLSLGTSTERRLKNLNKPRLQRN